MEYSKNSVTSFELPFNDSLCVFAASDVDDDLVVAEDDGFLRSAARLSDGILAARKLI